MYIRLVRYCQCHQSWACDIDALVFRREFRQRLLLGPLTVIWHDFVDTERVLQGMADRPTTITVSHARKQPAVSLTSNRYQRKT